MLLGISKQVIGLIAIGFMFTFATTGFTQNKNDSQEGLQGEWIVASITYADVEIKGTARNPMRVTFHENRMVTSPRYSLSHNWGFYFSQSDTESKTTTTIALTDQDSIAIFKINPEKSPMEIDIESTHIAPHKKGKDIPLSKTKDKNSELQKGIYRFKNEELEIFLGKPMGTRPADFTAGNHWVALKLIREKK